jgi:hypothetical protein
MMNQNRLRLVVDNAARPRRPVPLPIMRVDFRRLFGQVKHVARVAWMILIFPIRVVTGACRIAVATGRGFLRGIVGLALGLLGLAIICMVCFALIRVVFHPLFH